MNDRRLLVAVIDDDAAVGRATRRLLDAYGYRARTFTSSQEFLEDGADEAPYHCLIVDMHMPGLSGLELQTALTARGSRVPIVFITGAGDESLRNRAMAEGAVAFLQKPFGDVELFGAIEQAASRPERLHPNEDPPKA